MNELPFLMIFFVFTAAMLTLTFVRIASIVLPGTAITLPCMVPFTEINPGHAIIFYPSMMFQVWFWAEKLGVFL